MAIELIGMIGVRPEGADGAAVHVIGGEIDLGWVRDFSQAHERAGFDKVLVGYTATSADGFLVSLAGPVTYPNARALPFVTINLSRARASPPVVWPMSAAIQICFNIWEARGSTKAIQPKIPPPPHNSIKQRSKLSKAGAPWRRGKRRLR